LNLWTNWVDDVLSCAVSNDDLTKSKEIFRNHLELDVVEELAELIGCKVEYERDKGKMVVTQPVLTQIFIDKFELGDEKYPVTSAIPNSILVEGSVPLDKMKHYMYQKGVGKLMHLSKYTRPDVLNSVRELSRFGANPTKAPFTAMLRVLKYCVGTKEGD
jgi:hypothetical protein